MDIGAFSQTGRGWNEETGWDGESQTAVRGGTCPCLGDAARKEADGTKSDIHKEPPAEPLPSLKVAVPVEGGNLARAAKHFLRSELSDLNSDSIGIKVKRMRAIMKMERTCGGFPGYT